MGNSEQLNVYIYVGLPDTKQDEFIHRIKDSDPDNIITAVCEMLHVTKMALKSTTRKRDVVEARFIGINLILNANPEMTLKEVGKIFNRDHSTIVYARDTYYQLIMSDRKFQDKVALVKQKV
jgi:chromosomal replication initiator protein